MTRKKPVETEVVEGTGASSRLVLVLKAETKSGYAGVTPNGKRGETGGRLGCFGFVL